jgi:outer membrane cobalamin receptor
MSLTQFSTEVTVTTANRREQLLLDVAEPTTLIDEAQILDSGGRTAKDLLVQQAGSGVQVNAGGGQGHVSLNGIPNSGVLVLIDGRRMLGRDANGNFNIEEISLSGIERIEVVRGPSSAIYGADALGGVINFVSKKAEYRGWRNTLSLLGGSYGDLRGSDSLGVRRGRGGVSLFGAYRSYDGYDLDGDSGPQTVGQPESTFKNAGLTADFRFTPKLVARLFTDYNRRDIDKYFFAGATQQASTVFNSVRDLTREMIAPGAGVSPRADTSFNVSFNYGRYLRDETQIFARPATWCRRRPGASGTRS